MSKQLRIGTRASALALWQAEHLKNLLENLGHSCVLVPIKSSGDLNLTQPLYAMGIQGIFTKALDSALLEDQIDLAVHSLKDVPTILPKGLTLGAVLPRANPHDILVYHKDDLKTPTIGTGSLRRKAQWLYRNTDDRVENLRGNVQKRLEKLDNSNWKGAIFALAGLERLEQQNRKYDLLEWMIPAPAQGTIGISCKEEEQDILETLQLVHCSKTAQAVSIEREFLNHLEGGCTAPIGAYVQHKQNKLHFKGGLFALDGSEAFIHEEEISHEMTTNYGQIAAKKILDKGGRALMQQIKCQL